MGDAQQLFVLNPGIGRYEKKYILGIDSDAKSLFEELCGRSVYIDGFVDSDNRGMFLYHKPVYSMSELERECGNSIFLGSGDCSAVRETNICSDVLVLNPELYAKKVFIYGSGKIGKEVFPILEDAGIEIVGFIDSNEAKVGQRIYGKMIYGKDILTQLGNESVIIEAGKGCYEIDAVVTQVNADIQRFEVMGMPLEHRGMICVDQKKQKYIGECAVGRLGEYCRYVRIEEIVLYGSDLLLAKKCAEILECLDFGSISLVADQDMGQDIPVIEEIIYKEHYLLLLYDEKERFCFDRIYELGVERKFCGKNILVSDWYWPDWRGDKFIVDVNMGHTYTMNWKYPGIYLYGKNREDDYKIAVLGGSTTDSMLFDDVPSWVEIMYEQYCRSNITIFNGGVGAYNSAHELGKLTRDIMKLSPDMVLVYDGFNDCAANNSFQYLEKLVHYAGRHIAREEGGAVHSQEAWKGVPSKGNCIDDWLDNIESMYAITSSRNIKFFSFMQPSLGSKKNLDPHSKTLYYTYHTFPLAKKERQFRERAYEIAKTHEYIYDLTDIFDDVDVYMDMAHVYEKGNQIVAEHIWNVIKKDLKLELIYEK